MEQLFALIAHFLGFTNMPVPAQDIDAWHLLVQQQYPRWQGLLKRAAAHARLQRRIHTNVAKYHRRFLQTLRDFAFAGTR